MQLYPNDMNIEVNNVFARTAFEGLNAQVATYSDMSTPIDWSKNPRPRPRFVREIDISGNHVRTAIDRLFQQQHIDAGRRSAIEDPIRELEKCLEYNAKLSKDITSAQKSIIESFVEPYLDILKEEMEPWQIKDAIDHACIIVKGFVDPEHSFKSVMKSCFISPNPMQMVNKSNPSQLVINQEWNKEKQDKILDSLYMIAKRLSLN